jgi:hypothetical protein
MAKHGYTGTLTKARKEAETKYWYSKGENNEI